jgi:hypothetical protein
MPTTSLPSAKHALSHDKTAWPPCPAAESSASDSHDEEDAMVTIGGARYLRIRHVDRMPPFLMSVVSDSDGWLFVGSNGGFTAGRTDPDHALFPYLTVDKILNRAPGMGSLTLVGSEGLQWEPWSGAASGGDVTRNLYKHIAGTSVMFEEIHHVLGLAFRWELAVSQRFGLVRSCQLENLRDGRRKVRLLDGWNHLLPAGITQEMYSKFSYLAAAYMRHEALGSPPLGIHTLNSGITDRAEPSESLRVACTWSLGLASTALALSARQVDAFRHGADLAPETEARGVFGAHLLQAEVELPPHGAHEWTLVADTGLDHSDVKELRRQLDDPAALQSGLRDDLAAGVMALRRRIAGAGALQQTADAATCVHHFANVVFNCMRGGTLHDNYSFPRRDFAGFLQTRNREVARNHSAWIATLPDPCDLRQLIERAADRKDPQLSRLAGEYLPICFSRRHGDPSRPWNRFEIHTKDADGRPLFAYAGNWRDIFQNWEGLAYSYPDCLEPMIAIFLNASTADGYNPYRVTRAGIDWEIFEPHDPWSHIGYWGDHQIIYLLRLLEALERFQPGKLGALLDQRRHSYAHVPYEIRGFEEIARDPKNTIEFNHPLHLELMERTARLGGDGKLLAAPDGRIILVPLIEKLLVPLLVKLSNFVPAGGIWLNTQRPEWNDANNALAGWGLSVVTVGYLRRYLVFLADVIHSSTATSVELSKPVAELLSHISAILPAATQTDISDAERRRITEALGRAGEQHRRAVYSTAQTFGHETVTLDAVRELIAVALPAVDATLAANRRPDGLFHSYNLLELGDGTASVHHLDLMLEGQVSALSSGVLEPRDALLLLTTLRDGPLYRQDQNSYLLYPDRTITPFLERNTLPAGWESQIPGLAALAKSGRREIIRIAGDGRAHFHPDLPNSRVLEQTLVRWVDLDDSYRNVATERTALLELWEQVFHHRSFTGRSGAMFAFEGLGSIYWHMVSKLLLAVQETHHRAPRGTAEAARLAAAYDDIRNGLGFTKTSRTYGAFPTDPYSHSPGHAGAQQPGMTGQVKEEILTRMGEFGIQIQGGRVCFDPILLKRSEFIDHPHDFETIDLAGTPQLWNLGAHTLGFTLFQVPICYRIGTAPSIEVEMCDATVRQIDGKTLPEQESALLFARNGTIRRISVTLDPAAFQPTPAA